MEEKLVKKRVTSNYAGEVRRAIEPALALIGPWREAVALMTAALPRSGDTDRVEMTQRCAAIRREIHTARGALVKRLAQVSAKAAGSSRVADVEEAFNSIEAAVDDLDDRMGH